MNESAEKHLDHTLLAKLFWPLSTGPTLLCSDCNNVKHDKWPSEVYTRPQLKKLSVLTGIAFNLLGGPPKVNPEAVERIIKQVDNFVETWIPLPEDIKRVRKTILEYDGRDIFDFAKHVPPFLLEEESQPQR